MENKFLFNEASDHRQENSDNFAFIILISLGSHLFLQAEPQVHQQKVRRIKRLEMHRIWYNLKRYLQVV